jgi:uncharacterized protein involved in exopolysaccharide biosynthesis
MTDLSQNVALRESNESEISILDLLQVVADNLRLLVLGPLAVGLLAFAISFMVPPTYTATVKFLPPQQQQQSGAASLLQSLGSLGGLAGAASGIKNPNDQFVGLLKSRTLQDALIDRFQLQERYEEKFKVDARKEFDGNTRVLAGKDNIISIEFDDRDPVFAATVANAHIDEFRLLLAKLALTEAQQRRAMFEKQLIGAKDKLIKAEQALKATGVNASALKSAPTAAIGLLAQIQAQVTAQEVKVSSMRGYLADTSPQFRQAQTELAALRSQLARVEGGTTAQDSGAADYVVVYREFKYQETLYELFAKQFELAKVDEAREGAAIQVVDIAVPPERKAKPKKALITILATIVAGFALLVFVFIRAALASAVQTDETKIKLARLRRACRAAIGKA